jgi:GH15 family glucan-1,4-alpha-glucosidase
LTRIEDYGFLSDTQTAALVSRDGCIDWLCFPQFDSAACFASLLGTGENGRWNFTPVAEVTATRRRYRGDTLILETEFETADGAVRLIDFMPPRGKAPDIVRIVEGLRGSVALRMDLVIRFDYGAIVPWVRKRNGALEAIAGPDALILRTPVTTRGENFHTVADFTVGAGERVPFVLTWFPSHEHQPAAIDAEHALRDTERFWTQWASRFEGDGPYRDAVVRSLVTLKGLTYAPTGGLVAAATTSLPEKIGGVRNWDYRFCWLRDATYTLITLMRCGYHDEAKSFRDWLLRAVAGNPARTQIMYGVRGERRLTEFELPWLSGYENSRPVRIGNAASEQFQIDVYGGVMHSIYTAHRAGLGSDEDEWRMQVALMNFLEGNWDREDEGIWEVRGPRRHFTQSKMMAWVAFDRAVKMIEECGHSADGKLELWRAIRDEIHAQVCARGYNTEKKAFTQSYDSDALDAAVLMAPMIGFLPATDERILGTIAAIERELTVDGFVLRYRPEEAQDGLPSDEGVFLACSFWMADCLHLTGRTEEARELFERLLSIRNDLGLLAEEYDPVEKRQLGNFPQAFSHFTLVATAQRLSEA